MSSTADLLAAAREAEFKLQTGTAVVEFEDANCERVRYQPANAHRLAAYIKKLETQLAAEAAGTTPAVGPLQVWN